MFSSLAQVQRGVSTQLESLSMVYFQLLRGRREVCQ